MLADDGTTVDGDDLPAWEGLSDEAEGFCVEVGLVVGRTEHCPVDDEEIGVGRWQTVVFAFCVEITFVDRSGHGELEQTVGLSLKCAEGAQLRLHQVEFLVLRVIRIVAPYI